MFAPGEDLVRWSSTWYWRAVDPDLCLWPHIHCRDEVSVQSMRTFLTWIYLQYNNENTLLICNHYDTTSGMGDWSTRWTILLVLPPGCTGWRLTRRRMRIVRGGWRWQRWEISGIYDDMESQGKKLTHMRPSRKFGICFFMENFSRV